MDPYDAGVQAGPVGEARVARSVAGELATQLVKLMSRYTGRGPTRVNTTVNTNLIAVVMQDTLTTAEHNLVAAGQSASVRETRRKFHEMMREEASGVVEGLTGRRVIALLSDLDPEQNVAGQLFILERRPETGIAATAEATSDDI
jgi:uncharacterized protein YbcI